MKYTRKPYQPIMSSRKLRGLKEVSENNLANSMGQINRFLKLNVSKFNGFEREIARYETYQDVEYPVFSEEYIPIYSVCVHCRCAPFENNTFKASNNPLCMIKSKYDSMCIPIYEGSKYKIYGNRMIIMSPDDKSGLDASKYFRYTEFIIDNSDNRKDEEFKSKVNGILFDLYDSLYLYKDLISTIYIDRDYGFRDHYYYEAQDLYDSISEKIKNAIVNNKDSDEDVHLTVTHISKNMHGGNNKSTDVEIIINPKKVLDPLDTSKCIKFKIDEDDDVSLYNVFIECIDDNCEEDDDEDDIEWSDGYPIDDYM